MAQLKSTLINGNLTVLGALNSQGNITAASFVKSGGTSSQILMADGSVLDKSTFQSAGSYVTIAGTETVSGTKTFSAVTTFSNTTDATSTTAAAVKVTGGLGVAKQLRVGTTLTVGSTGTFTGAITTNSTTDSSSTSTGALIVKGGAGVAKNLYVGGDIYVPENKYAYFGTDQLASFRANASGQFVVGSYGSMHFRASLNSNDSTSSSDGFALTAAALYPETNKGLDLGSTSNYFSTVYGNHFRLDAGSLEKQYEAASDVPVIKVGVKNIDATLLKVYSNDQTYSDTGGLYGFSLKYIGTGNGVANNLRLIADNQTSPKTAIDINQEGRIGINTTYSSSYYLNVNGNSNITGTLTVTSTLNSGGVINANNTTDSTATTNGSVVVDGGVGVAKQIRAGGNITSSGNVTAVEVNVGSGSATMKYDSTYEAITFVFA